MPPGTKPNAELIEAVRTWIAAGAPWAEAADQRWGSYKPEDLWAFQRLRRDIKGSIDEWIVQKTAYKMADKRTLIRRATIDLTGLPPAYEEVEAFVADKAPDAYARLIERLLASPRYGERWGRHWLDVARYADSSGYSNDFERPNAWRYRDYVIRAFNADKPYDRFVREQIAGDELYPGDAEALIATGFLRMGPWEHTGMSVEAVTRQMFLDDVTHNTAATFLGLTLGCAKCHDHKFDPIPTRDYYRMQAVFATTEFARPGVPFLPSENTADLEAGMLRMNRITASNKAHMDRFDHLAVENMMRKHGVARREDLPKELMTKAVRDKEGISAEQFEEYKLYQKHGQLYRESLDRYHAKAFAVSSGPLDGATDGGPNLRYPKRAEYKAPDIHILPGGNIQSPAQRVEPGLLSAIAKYAGLPEPEVPATIAGRRSALANWIVDPANPLTARVMVNRIWQYHFGHGIAADANNFGKMGAKPAHPELLDMLASKFISSGWSVKAMHRLIMQSAAYRAQDFTPRRVEAEVLRDSVLAVSGELSEERGGPGTFPQINEDVARQPRHAMGSVQPAYYPSAKKRMRNRRTIYTFQQRSLVDPLVDVFNGPNLDISCERRESSVVPTQAFALFNGQAVHDAALALAARVDAVPRSDEARVAELFRRIYQRTPADREMRAVRAHLKKMTSHHQSTPPPGKPVFQPIVHRITSELTGEAHQFTQERDPEPYEPNLHPSEVKPETRALADVALVLMNSNEFVYVY
jgi:hypothetical protein